MESEVNPFLDCRDGIVECYEYTDCSGRGSKVKLFLCENTKHESVAIIRQYKTLNGDLQEESMYYESDDFKFLSALIKGDIYEFGEYTLVRDY